MVKTHGTERTELEMQNMIPLVEGPSGGNRI